MSDLTREDLSDAIDRAVADFLGDDAPLDPVALARRRGVVVGQGRAAGRKAAVLRAEPTEERRQWLAAHALADGVVPGVLDRLSLESPRELGGTSLVNLVVDRLLVPTPAFLDAVREVDYDLNALKGLFPAASYELLALRMLDLPSPCVVTFLDNGAITTRKGNAVRPSRALAPPEARCLDVVRRTSRPHDLDEAGWRVQGWPIHAVDWRREVLRSVPPEEG